jgi:hypothetical protein
MKARGKTVMARQRKETGRLFRPGSLYDTTLKTARRKPGLRKETLARHVAKAARTSRKKAGYAIDVLSDPNHRSNRCKGHPKGRVRANRRMKKAGKIVLESI